MRALPLIALVLTIAGFDSAQAAVIPGPALDQADSGHAVSGLDFNALQNSILTSFTFQNQGKADTVVLTDSVGNILHSISTPALTPSYTANINWSLTGGNKYFLLQTTDSNSMFANFNSPLPSDADIAIAISWIFDDSIASAVTENCCSGIRNLYWAAFNDVTTNETPLPGALPLFVGGLGALGALGWRRKKASAPAA